MNVGDLKRWLTENEVSDDTPLWKPTIEIEGGLEYPGHWGGELDNVQLATETFGLALPRDKQTRETGVMLW
jgi:hypothetical protein